MRRSTQMLLILLCCGQVSARTLSLPSDAGAPSGESATVALSIDDATGIEGSDLLILYDPSIALATGVTKTALSAGHALAFNLDPPGEIRISLFGATPLAGGGELLSLSFVSVGGENGETPLDLAGAALNEGTIPSVLVDGRYCVQDLAGEVPLLQVGPVSGGGAASLAWTPAPFAIEYEIYSASRPDLQDLACHTGHIPGLSTEDDGAIPALGRALFYLAAGRNCRGRSPLGTGSGGAARPYPDPCP